MAKKPDDAEVILADEGDVEIDISDNPELAQVQGAEAAEEAKAQPEPKKPLPRVRLKEPEPEPEEAPEVQAEASKALEEAVRKATEAENARKAAEATALAERQQREAALRRVAQLEQDVQLANERAEQSELLNISNSLEASKAEWQQLELALQAAYEAGDFKTAASTQGKLSLAAARVDRLEAAKAEYEAGTRRQPVAEGRVEAPQPVATPFEQFIQANNFAPAAASWLRQHPECVPAQFGGDQSKHDLMLRGHRAALAKGIPANTPEYFKEIEEMAGYRQKEAAAEPEPQQVTTKKPAAKAQPSAPVTRETPAAPGVPRNTRSVTLTKDQQEAARLSFPTMSPQQAYAQYARNMIELEAEGKLGRLTH